MIARQCEACKKCYPNDIAIQQLFTVTKYKRYKYYGHQHIADLCPECYKKLLNIFGMTEEEGYGKEKYNANKQRNGEK